MGGLGQGMLHEESQVGSLCVGAAQHQLHHVLYHLCQKGNQEVVLASGFGLGIDLVRTNCNDRQRVESRATRGHAEACSPGLACPVLLV